MDGETDAIDRGLQPLRIRFVIHILSIKVPAHLQGKKIVLSCERKGQTTVTENPVHVASSVDDIQVNQVLELYLTVARREKIGAEASNSHDPVVSSESIPGFETIMARITLRNESMKGAVLDCVPLNLANFIPGGHFITKSELSLRLGGKLSISVEAEIEDEDFLGKDCEKTGTPFAKDEDVCASVAKSNSSDTSSAVQKSASKKSFGSCCNTTEITPPDAGVSLSTESTARPISGAGSNERHNEKLFSSCTTNGEQDNLVELSATNEDTVIVQKEHTQAGKIAGLWRGVFSWNAEKEYSTQYSRGTWKETPRLLELDGPQKLILWSIEGPSDDTDEQEGAEEGDGPRLKRKHKSMTVSCSKPGPPAKVGKLSPMQKCILAPKVPVQPMTIPLGAPISLLRSSVLAASKFLVHEIKYVDEPLLSDSEEEEGENEEDEEEDEDEDEDEGDDKGGEEEEEDDEDDEDENEEDENEEDEKSTDDENKKVEEEREKEEDNNERNESENLFTIVRLDQSSREENMHALDKQLSALRLSQPSESCENSKDEESDEARTDHETDEEILTGERNVDEGFDTSIGSNGPEQPDESTFQVCELEKCIFQLREELESVLIENEKLRSELGEGRGENSRHDVSRENVLCKDCCGSGDDKRLIGDLKRQLRAERDKNIRCRLEQERLLQVILTLTSELDREVGSRDFKKNNHRIDDPSGRKLGESEKMDRIASKSDSPIGIKIAERTSKGKHGKKCLFGLKRGGVACEEESLMYEEGTEGTASNRQRRRGFFGLADKRKS